VHAVHVRVLVCDSPHAPLIRDGRRERAPCLHGDTYWRWRSNETNCLPCFGFAALCCGWRWKRRHGRGARQRATPTTAGPDHLGDDPADRLVAASVTINSMALISAGGGSIAVMSTPRPMEMMRLMGTVAPLAMAGVPQGTYTGVTMTFGASTVTYVDTTTGLPVQRTVPGPMTTTVMFGSPLVVGTNTMSSTSTWTWLPPSASTRRETSSMTPAMREFHNPAVTGSANPEDGGMHGLTGMVGSVGGSTFTMTMVQGMSGIALSTGAGTQYAGMSGMGMMGGGALMSVDATMPSGWNLDGDPRAVAHGRGWGHGSRRGDQPDRHATDPVGPGHARRHRQRNAGHATGRHDDGQCGRHDDVFNRWPRR